METNTEISIDENCNNPNLAYSEVNWDHIRRRPNKPFKEVGNVNNKHSKQKLRVVLISDTHSTTDGLVVPNADVLIHAGDFTNVGKLNEVVRFNEWLGTLPHKHKVVIAGNRELSFGFADKNVKEYRLKRSFRFDLEDSDLEDLDLEDLDLEGSGAVRDQMERYGVSHPRELLTNCTYLQDSSVTIAGLKIYGSPWSSWFHDWAYNLERGEKSLEIWNKIPTDTDILITHGPPLGVGDRCVGDIRAGCTELYTTVTKRVKPKLHVFGHILEDYGVWSDGVTRFVNACVMNEKEQLVNRPVCMEFDIPDDVDEKSDIKSSSTTEQLT